MPQLSERLVLVGLMLVAVHAVPAGAASNLETVPDAPLNSDVQIVEGDILFAPRMMQRGIGVRAGVRVWQDGIVPYYFDPELDPLAVKAIQTAVDTWNKLAGISLIEVDPNRERPDDYLHFIPAQGCASWIGRQGGAQTVWAAPSCSSGSMMHEIGHALGLEHEHTRPDRDQHIKIRWENIDVDKSANFDISQTDKQYYGDYDFASIMHYGEFFFSANGQATIEPLYDSGAAVGQRVAPSAGDIAAIARLYGSDVSLVSSVVGIANSSDNRSHSEINLLVTNEYGQGANNLEIELDIGTAKLVSNNSEWQCSTHAGKLHCQLDRLAGHSRSALVLVVDQVLSETELNPSLVTKTPDDNLINNVGVFSPAAANGGDQLYADGQNSSAGSLGVWLLSGLMFLLFGRGARKELY